MSETKVDLRVAKTQLALCTSLFVMLETTPFPKITVNDLCKTAMVSRATFYMHFEDKYHLLRFALEQMSEQVRAEPDRRATLEKTVLFAYEKKRVLRNLLDDSNHELSQMFQHALIESIADSLRLAQEEGRVFSVPIPVLAAFIAGGLASILLLWIAGGFDFSPQEMAEHLLVLSDRWEKLD